MNSKGFLADGTFSPQAIDAQNAACWLFENADRIPVSPFSVCRNGHERSEEKRTSSAPFVATLVDVTGLMIYFSIALLIMRGTML